LLSTRYVASVVLADRRCWLDQFTPERTQDPAVAKFAQERVSVEVDPSVEGNGAMVEVTDRDGRSYVDRRAAPRGDATDPLSRGEIVEKLRMSSAGRFSDASVERLIQLVTNIEQVERVGELCTALRTPTAVLV
jgi:2-methylcitrate dehydratase PrpD